MVIVALSLLLWWLWWWWQECDGDDNDNDDIDDGDVEDDDDADDDDDDDDDASLSSCLCLSGESMQQVEIGWSCFQNHDELQPFCFNAPAFLHNISGGWIEEGKHSALEDVKSQHFKILKKHQRG